MHILFKLLLFYYHLVVVLGLLLSVHLGDDGSLLIFDLLVNLSTSTGLISVGSGSVGGLLSSLLLLIFLLLLLDSLSIGEGVGNGSLVGFVESVVGVLGCSLKVLSGVCVTCVDEIVEEEEVGYSKGRKGKYEKKRNDQPLS